MTTAGRALAAVLACAFAAAPAAAYQRDEHYYTTRLSLGRQECSDLAGVCSQLADEAPELNAIAVYRRLMLHPFDYAGWTVHGGGADRTAGLMYTTQQLLHGLTGGSPKAVRAIAADLARTLFAVAKLETDPVKRADAMCAVGFALHLYGDSYAHQRIKNPAKMYDTGIGHFFDATKPDLPLYSEARFELWRDYMLSAPAVVPESKPEPLGPIFSAAAESRRRARSGNEYARDELWLIERHLLEGRGLKASPLARNASNRPCQEILDAGAKGLAVKPSCEGAWDLYRDAAAVAFDKWDADPEHAAAPSRAGTRRRYSVESPFAPGGPR